MPLDQTHCNRCRPTNMPQDISGQIALITGASSGIGAACAEAFAKQGCHLVLAARRAQKLQQLSDKLMQEHKVCSQALKTCLQHC